MDNVTIVVSRFNENLSWMNEHPFNLFKYTVYNKGNNQDFEQKYIKEIVNLPNVGRCDHTYLYHIVKHYHNLTNIIVFFPGSVDMDTKKPRAINILNSIINSNYTSAYFYGTFSNSIQELFYDFKLDEWICSYEKNKLQNNENKLLKCKFRPFGIWYSYFFGKINAQWFTCGGVFSIDKKDIIQNSIIRYINLLGAVRLHSNPEVGHYIERSWAAIFHPLNNTKTIHE